MRLWQVALVAMCVAGCSREPAERPAAVAAPAPEPPQAGPPREQAIPAAPEPAARAAAEAAAPPDVAPVQEPVRPAIRLADPARAADREAARTAARGVPGVRSAVWIDRENLLVDIDRDQARGHDTIDAICAALDPLGDTLGVIVNLHSRAANGGGLEVVSRACQLPPGAPALDQADRSVDGIPPEIRAQQKQAQALGVEAAKRAAEQAESMKVLEATTPEMTAPVTSPSVTSQPVTATPAKESPAPEPQAAGQPPTR